jgi:hypothetical protein
VKVSLQVRAKSTGFDLTCLDLCDKLVADLVEVANTLAKSDDLIFGAALGSLQGSRTQQKKLSSLGKQKGAVNSDTTSEGKVNGIYKAVC